MSDVFFGVGIVTCIESHSNVLSDDLNLTEFQIHIITDDPSKIR